MQINVSTRLTQEVEIENQKRSKLVGLIAWIVGLIGCLIYIVVAVAFYGDGEDPLWLEILLWLSAGVFAVGLILHLTAKKTIKKAETNDFLNEYSFEDSFVTVISYRGEEKIAEVKNYYTEFTKIRKTEKYLFLCMGMRGAYPIERSLLTEEQTAWIYSIIKKK